MSGLILSASRRNLGNFCTVFRGARFVFSRPLSSDKAAEERRDKQSVKGASLAFTESYLVNSCGLSLESAKSICKYVRLCSPENSDSVLRLLKNYGFTDDQITKVVRVMPRVLLLHPETVLLPKLEFLDSINLSRADTVEFVSFCPTLLCSSLENRLIPCYDFLKSVLNRDEDILKCLRRSQWIFTSDLQNRVIPKVSILRGLGVQQPHIKQLLLRAPGVFCCSPKRFEEVLEKVTSFGIQPTKLSFVQALIVMCQLGESTWERKIEVFKSLGLSEEDVHSSFQSYPCFMQYSEKKIRGVMNFLMNTIGLHPLAIVRFPFVLTLSLEKRIRPRCLGIRILLSKGFLKVENVNYFATLKLPDKRFLERFVIPYQKEIPLLLSVVHGEIDPKELC